MRFIIPFRTRHKRAWFCLAAAILFAPAATCAAAKPWKQHADAEGFVIDYPADWFIQGRSVDKNGRLTAWGIDSGISLSIGSQRFTVGGTNRTFRDGQAWILAFRTDRPFAESVVKYSTSDEVNPEPPISLTKQDLPATQGCSHIKQLVLTEYEFGGTKPLYKGERPRVYTDYLCETPTGVVTVILHNWAGDRRIAADQAIALKMAQSIRPGKRTYIAPPYKAPDKQARIETPDHHFGPPQSLTGDYGSVVQAPKH